MLIGPKYIKLHTEWSEILMVQYRMVHNLHTIEDGGVNFVGGIE